MHSEQNHYFSCNFFIGNTSARKAWTQIWCNESVLLVNILGSWINNIFLSYISINWLLLFLFWIKVFFLYKSTILVLFYSYFLRNIFHHILVWFKMQSVYKRIVVDSESSLLLLFFFLAYILLMWFFIWNDRERKI